VITSLAKVDEKQLERAADIYVATFARTCDETMARRYWCKALSVPITRGADLLPDDLFQRGLRAMEKSMVAQRKRTQGALNRALKPATEFLERTLDLAKRGKLEGATERKALDVARWLMEKELEMGGGRGGKKAATPVQTNVQVNLINAQNARGQSVEELEKVAASIVLDCSEHGPGGVDSVQPPGQGEGDDGASSPTP
jgi:hypothetical protein